MIEKLISKITETGALAKAEDTLVQKKLLANVSSENLQPLAKDIAELSNGSIIKPRSTNLLSAIHTKLSTLIRGANSSKTDEFNAKAVLKKIKKEYPRNIKLKEVANLQGNTEEFKLLWTTKNERGCHKFYTEEINMVMSALTPANKSCLPSLMDQSSYNICDILTRVSEDNKFAFKPLMEDARFDKATIPSILSKLIKDKSECFDLLLQKKCHGKPEFEAHEIDTLLNLIKSDSADSKWLNHILKTNENSKETIQKCIEFNNTQKDLIIPLHEKGLTLEESLGFLKNKVNEDNKEYIGELIKTFKPENGENRLSELSDINRNANKYNIKPFLRIINSRPDLDNTLQPHILSLLNGKNNDIVEFLFTAQKADGTFTYKPNYAFGYKSKIAKVYCPEILLDTLKKGKSPEETAECFKLFDYKLPHEKILKGKSVNDLNESEKLDLTHTLLQGHKKFEDGDKTFATPERREAQPIFSAIDFPLMPKNETEKVALEANLLEQLNAPLRGKKISKDQISKIKSGLSSIDKCSDKEMETVLNKIKSAFGEEIANKDIIKNLKSLANQPVYKDLSESERNIAKLSIIFNDIAGNNSLEKEEQALKSAFKAFGYCKNLGLQDRECERVYGLVKNQNWAEKLVNNSLSAKDAAIEFRKPNDFEIAQAINKSKDNSDISKELSHQMQEVEKKIEEIHKTAIPLSQTFIPKASELKNIPEVTLGKGNTTVNKIIDLTENPDLESMGFTKGTTVDNFEAIVHTLRPEVTNYTAAVDFAQKEGHHGMLSCSYVSKSHYSTFNGNKYGFILDVDPTNIGAAISNDAGTKLSGTEETFKSTLFSYQLQRSYISSRFELNVESKHRDMPKEIIEKAYVDIYRNLAQHYSLCDVSDEQLASIIKKSDSAKQLFNSPQELRETLSQATKELYNTPEYFIKGQKIHNEVYTYAGKPRAIFVKEFDIHKLPYELRKYAQDNDMPIIVFAK